jgi:thymidylate synthase
MHVVDIENGRDGYVNILEHVWDHGVRRAPRGMSTVDAGPTTIVVHDINNALPLGTGRGINQRIAAIEAIQLIAGVATPEMVVKASPNFEKYREPNGSFYGAYGRRIHGQVQHVIRKLTSDCDSRQAVITLWSPLFDNADGMRDYPCTVALHFALINDELTMNVVMRSNDAWLGIPYDIFQFTQLQWSIAFALGANPGTYRHTAWSLHLYETNFDAVEELISSDIDPGNAYQPMGIGSWLQSWDDIESMAYNIINGSYDIDKNDLTESEKWYDKHIEPLR